MTGTPHRCAINARPPRGLAVQALASSRLHPYHQDQRPALPAPQPDNSATASIPGESAPCSTANRRNPAASGPPNAGFRRHIHTDNARQQVGEVPRACPVSSTCSGVAALLRDRITCDATAGPTQRIVHIRGDHELGPCSTRASRRVPDQSGRRQQRSAPAPKGWSSGIQKNARPMACKTNLRRRHWFALPPRPRNDLGCPCVPVGSRIQLPVPKLLALSNITLITRYRKWQAAGPRPSRIHCLPLPANPKRCYRHHQRIPAP